VLASPSNGSDHQLFRRAKTFPVAFGTLLNTGEEQEETGRGAGRTGVCRRVPDASVESSAGDNMCMDETCSDDNDDELVCATVPW
jgi:hypothetical protein